MRVLLISTYELGHQPLHVASPAAALEAAGHHVRALDLSVQDWATEGAEAVAWAEAVAFSVPMHTAMRLALAGARSVREARPDLPICLYGLYALVSASTTVGSVVDRAIAGEYEPALLSWLEHLDGPGRPDVHPHRPDADPDDPGGDRHRPGAGGPPLSVELGRQASHLPARHLLPPLDRYARLQLATDPQGPTEERLAGYVEASRGCAHRCRHCPVPTVYDGRTRAVDEEVVLADVAQLVALGAGHLTFGDPDFLNRPHHALRVARAVHRAFPHLTFDATVKVEHVLRHEGVWPELAGLGCLFVVSAFECVDDATLAKLDKGHTTADASRSVALLRDEGIEVRPSFMPFTPWTSLGQIVDLFDWVAAHDLVGNVDPVQYSIRLLVPEGSLLLGRDDLDPHLGPYDPDALTWTWHHPDPRVDALQVTLASLAARSGAGREPMEETYSRMRAEVVSAAGSPPVGRRAPASSTPPEGRAGRTGVGRRPRLTEPWFC